MKLRYDADYQCRSCGKFTLKDQANVHASVDCPKCHRTSDFVRGTVWRIEEFSTRKKHKGQKAIINESDT
jgi:phage FluMu protein Com